MGIKMNTYAGGQMTAGNDAILHDRVIANTGILHGCNITFMGANQIHIEKGYLLIKGRYCTVTEDTIQVAMSNSETELPGRLYVRADLADAQEPVKILSVAADPLPKLTQDENFNYDNGVWEVELATYTAGMTAIKDLTVTCEEVPEGASKKETAALLGKIDELTENLKDAAKKIVVLWTNPEWNSSTNLTPFVAQEIQIDNISDFDMIGICHSAYNNTHNYFNFFLNIFNKENNLTEMFSEVKVTDYYVRLYYRKFIITQSGIKFDIGYSNSHTQVAANNSYAIPVKIIGIKF